MKFGFIPPYGLAPVEDGNHAATLANLVESFGFESLWVTEHVVVPAHYDSRYPYDPSGRMPLAVDTPQPDPLIWLTWAAAATERLRLATGVLNLPQRNPVVLAKALATLDRLSGGRVILGVGVGWLREEAVAVGSDWDTRGARCDEALEAMRALWRDSPASYRGEHVAFDAVHASPHPHNPTGIPIVIGGHGPAAVRRAARFGDGVYALGTPDQVRVLRDAVRAEATRHGRDPERIEFTAAGGNDPDAVKAWEDAGVDRLLYFPRSGDLAALREELSGYRDAVMGW